MDMHKATPDQIRSASSTTPEEVIAAMGIYAEMRSIENRLAELDRDFRGTVKGLTTPGFSEMSKIFRSLGGEDWYRFKDTMSYWREE